jgi:hypothetical protein
MQRFSYPGATDSVNQWLGSSVSVENPGKNTPRRRDGCRLNLSFCGRNRVRVDEGKHVTTVPL